MINELFIKNDEKTAYRIIEDEAVVVNVNESTFHTLNPVATLIWKNLDGNNRVEDLVQIIGEEFDVDPETALKDCIEFINDLLKKNLIKKI